MLIFCEIPFTYLLYMIAFIYPVFWESVDPAKLIGNISWQRCEVQSFSGVMLWFELSPHQIMMLLLRISWHVSKPLSSCLLWSLCVCVGESEGSLRIHLFYFWDRVSSLAIFKHFFYIFINLFCVLVYVHVCGHECHDADVEIGGQYDGVSFLSIMWVPGIELISSGLV